MELVAGIYFVSSGIGGEGIMKKRIWFNRWFSTAYHYIDMIRYNPEGREFEIFGTHPNRESVVLQNCDYAEIEPILDRESYIEYCLDFCARNKIDMFLPHYGLDFIGRRAGDFEKIGTRVLACSDGNLLDIINNKAAFYEDIKVRNIVEVPEYYVVNNVKEFKDAYESLTRKGFKVCFKPVTGEGGAGFRIIDNTTDSIDSLFNYVNQRITLDRACSLLATGEPFQDIMVLEYLEGYEYSIDCLAWGGRLLAAVPRKKMGGRLEQLEDNKELIYMAGKITESYGIPYVFNIQFRYSRGVPKLLEINPRMSGGLYMSSLSGVNFPYLVLKLLMGESVEVQKPRFDIMCSHVEKEIAVTLQDKHR